MENVIHPRTDSKECLYFIKCALSRGAEINCPCKSDLLCLRQLKNPCSSSRIYYPNGAIIAPYIFTLYDKRRSWSYKQPDYMQIKGAIKCRGYLP